jgi:hypothetical protein
LLTGKLDNFGRQQYGGPKLDDASSTVGAHTSVTGVASAVTGALTSLSLSSRSNSIERRTDVFPTNFLYPTAQPVLVPNSQQAPQSSPEVLTNAKNLLTSFNIFGSGRSATTVGPRPPAVPSPPAASPVDGALDVTNSSTEGEISDNLVEEEDAAWPYVR